MISIAPSIDDEYVIVEVKGKSDLRRFRKAIPRHDRVFSNGRYLVYNYHLYDDFMSMADAAAQKTLPLEF